MKEVEIKAYVLADDKKRVLSFLEKNAEFLFKKHKKDIYFCKKGKKEISFRIREENDNFIVNTKSRSLTSEGIEINDEKEFEIDDGAQFQEMMLKHQYSILFTKEKFVEVYEYNSILVEYVSLPGLGEFIEAEILCEDEKKIPEAKDLLLEFFETIDLTKTIEKKPYFELLKEKGVV